MLRLAAFLYGLFAALAAAVVFAYGVGFFGVSVLPESWGVAVRSTLIATSVDDRVTNPAELGLSINLLLLVLLVLQHVVMGRRWFWRLVKGLVPQPIQQSTYMLCTSVMLALLFWFWCPIREEIWNFPVAPARTVWQVLFAIGLLLVGVGLFSSKGFEAIGLRQAYRFWRGKSQQPPPLSRPLVYRILRHPMWLGALLMLWATPLMTLGHAMLAVLLSIYVLLAIFLAERDMIAVYGDAYREYQHRVPMLVPLTRWGKRRQPATSSAEP